MLNITGFGCGVWKKSAMKRVISKQSLQKIASYLQRKGFRRWRSGHEEHFEKYVDSGKIHVIIKPIRKGKMLLKVHLDYFPCIILQYSPTIQELINKILKLVK